MQGVPAWQTTILTGIILWIILSSFFRFSEKLRSLTQPWVTRRVISGIPLIIYIQKFQHPYLDALFSLLSYAVSRTFYTAFLPFLFWSGHGKLARQMTLLMAFCDYFGNCLKDVISAPRPNSPEVRKVIATDDEKECASEYGLPSSHVLNSVCFAGFLFHYITTYNQANGTWMEFAGYVSVILFASLMGFGRIYLGMHSPVDTTWGLTLGIFILAFWLQIYHQVDQFIIAGRNVTLFWAALSVLLLFAYPTPESPSPSFEYHTAFNGVALGIVTGIQQKYNQFHHDGVGKVFSEGLSPWMFFGRMVVGIPSILTFKLCGKVISKQIIPLVSLLVGIPVRSSGYIPSLMEHTGHPSLLHRYGSLDVDTGIRFVQYAALAWSVVAFAPSLFSYIGL